MIGKIAVDKDKCVHCGLCINDCVLGIMEFDEEKMPRYSAGKEGTCVGCQHCMAICPTGALSFGGKNPADSSDCGFGNSEDMLQLIKSRRSVRFYKDESVPADTLQKIVAMLPFIPTGGNRDNLHFSIVQSKERMESIRNAIYAAIDSSQVSSPLFDMAKKAFKNGNDIIFRGAPSLVAVAIDLEKTIKGCETADPIIALSYVELYAQSLGLGTLWCDMAVMAANEIPGASAMLEIPKNYTLNYIILLGVPAIRYKRTIQPEMFNIALLN